MSDVPFLSEDSVENLNARKKTLYFAFFIQFIQFLRTEGKNPERNRGYSESNIRPLARRIHQVFEWVWVAGEEVVELAPRHADAFVNALVNNDFTAKSDEPYAESSKRKFVQALSAYFRFVGKEWEPSVIFTDDPSSNGSDPFTKDERSQLMDAALEYKSPPSYSNLSPDERDRWKAHLAQVLGKPKEAISVVDWETLQKDWKVPSLISTSLDGGLRAKLVGRILVSHVNLEEGIIEIPPEVAVKNDKRWEIPLSTRSVTLLEEWIDQRRNLSKYDDSDLLWLNRKGNPYNSSTLNDLLSNLIEAAGIQGDNRKLTWHSIRHSTGMYIYDREKDLGLVAEILRHSTLESAAKYAHPTPEAKRDVVESIQGGGL